MSVESNRELGSKFFEAQDRLRGGPDPDLCSAGYKSTVNSFPEMDLPGHQGMAMAFYGGFPDLSHTVTKAIADESGVCVHFTVRGTHTADFMGIPASGKPILVDAFALLRVEGGKVSELRAILDQMSMMQQIGAVPSQ